MDQWRIEEFLSKWKLWWFLEKCLFLSDLFSFKILMGDFLFLFSVISNQKICNQTNEIWRFWFFGKFESFEFLFVLDLIWFFSRKKTKINGKIVFMSMILKIFENFSVWTKMWFLWNICNNLYYFYFSLEFEKSWRYCPL